MKTKIAFCIIAAATLGACASTATENGARTDGIAAYNGDPRLGEKVKSICFNRSIDGFSENTKNTVVLSKGVSDDYMVEVGGVCSKLDYAQSIGIDSTLTCVRPGDYLIVSDSAFSLNDQSGIGPDRCIIKDIRKWDKKAKADETPDAN